MRRLIDANALMDKLLGQYCKNCEKRKGIKRGKLKVIYGIGDICCRSCAVDDMTDELAEAPTIDPVRHGRWIDLQGTRVYCTECGEQFEWRTNYCPECGAKMDGERREDAETD